MSASFVRWEGLRARNGMIRILQWVAVSAGAGNIESLDPPSASAGTDWRMAQFAWHPMYNTPIFEETALGR